MAVPPPPKQNKLQAAVSRFSHQLDRTRAYIGIVRPALPQADDDPNVQYCFQTIVLMLHTFLEEYYRHLISIATFWEAEAVRIHLAKKYPQQAMTFEAMPSAVLARTAKREVSFKDSGQKLKDILAVLTTAGPFADDSAESKCLDLVNVRNIITHQGGWADESNVPTVRSADVIAKKAVVGNATFYELRISRQFLTDVLVAMGRSVAKMEAALNDDPRYSL